MEFQRDRLARILMQSDDSLTFYDARIIAGRLLAQGIDADNFYK